MAAEPASAPALSAIVIRLGALGDMINLTALLHLLHRRYGRPCVVIGAGPWCEPVYRGSSDVATTWVLDRHWPALLTLTGWRVLAALRHSHPAPIYVCDYDKQLRRVERLLTFSGIDRGRCLFLARSGDDEHFVDSLIGFGRRTPAALDAGCYPSPSAVHAGPRLSRALEPERAEVAAWITAQGWAARPLVLVQPGNRRTMGTQRRRHARLDRDDKTWPAGNWIELFRRIHAHMPEALIVLCGVAAEAPMLQQLRAATALPEVVTVATVPLRQFFALCERAHSMISIDTGPAHAAAAFGVPLVVMFGGERPSRWLPRSAAGTPVIGLGGPPVSSHVREIAVDAVFAAWCSAAMPRPSQQAARAGT
jgi:heptosyltransferase-2/heptosyltransferase-3